MNFCIFIKNISYSTRSKS